MDESCFFRVSIKGIVVDSDSRFLLTKESNGMWEILGGGLENKEDPIDCLRREIQEEAGLKVTYVSPTPKYFLTVERFEHPGYAANVIYEIRLENLDFTPSDECQELRFFNVEEARKVRLFPNVEKFLSAFDVKLHHA